MKITEAITKANSLRQNKLPDEQKYDAIMKLERQVAELMGKEMPERNYPDMDTELLMPYPDDEIYPLYLVCIIDFYQQDQKMYQNDSAIFEQAKYDAFSKWRRDNTPTQSGGFKVWQ